jgi:hypothetical protein
MGWLSGADGGRRWATAVRWSPSSRLSRIGDYAHRARPARKRQSPRLRLFTPECDIDAGGMPLVWLNDVKPDESVAWLASLVTAQPDAPRRDSCRRARSRPSLFMRRRQPFPSSSAWPEARRTPTSARTR